MTKYGKYTINNRMVNGVNLESMSHNGSIVTKNTYYNAFPTLAVMPNGNWLITYQKSAWHQADSDSITGAKISTDQGATWGEEFSLCPKTTVCTRYDSYLSCVGTRLFFFYTEKREVNRYYPYMRYSDDNAVTWSDEILIDSDFTDKTGAVIESVAHGNVIETPNGDLLYTLWGITEYTTSTFEILVIKSTDGGLTWSDLSKVHNRLEYDIINDPDVAGKAVICESNLIYAPNGKLLLVTRANGLIYTSLDNGATWDEGVSMGIDFGSPYFLLDGNDLYVFGRRKFLTATWNYPDVYDGTLIYIKSTDSGVTWGSQVVIDRYGGFVEAEGGYCCPVLYDGKIGIVTYTNDGYNWSLRNISLHQPYILFIKNIKDGITYDDLTKTHLKFTALSTIQSSVEIYEKPEGGDYSLVGTITNEEVKITRTPDVAKTYKYKARVGGQIFEQEEVIRFIYDSRAERIFNNVTLLSGSLTDARKLNMHNTIQALKAADLFENQFDALYVFRNSSAEVALMNWVQDAYNVTEQAFPGTLTFTADLGYHSDGTASYLHPYLNDIYLRKYRYNDKCFGFKLSGTITETGNQGHGIYMDNKLSGIGGNTTNHYATLSTTGAVPSASTKREVGYNQVTRNNSLTIKHMTNDTIVDVNSGSGVQANKPLILLACNNNDFSERWCSPTENIEMAWVGKYMTPEKFLIFQSIMNEYIANL